MLIEKEVSFVNNNINQNYRFCKKCLLSNIDDSNLIINEDGECEFCFNYEKNNSIYFFNPLKKENAIQLLVSTIKKESKSNKFDCLIGISGGVDSSYLTLKAVELGLNPLIVHLDNGWNSELAVSNIEQLINRLHLDLYTYVIDWDEFRDIQLSFLKASVIDIELTTDHAIIAVLYKVAKKHGIKNILLGSNHATESHLPVSWYHWKNDALNIKSIHKKFGKIKMKTFPYMNFYERITNDKFKHIQFINLLDYFNYNKDKAKQELIEKYGWKDYGGKHFESIFTRFYQGYILPVKFGVDKRKAHLSSLICSGQISKEQALEILKTNSYLETQAQEDKEYVIKKFGLTLQEFDKIMDTPPKSHFEYPSYITRHYKYLSWFTGFYKKK